MKYVRFLIGEHTIPMLLDLEHPDANLLYASGEKVIYEYNVRLPETREVAEALGRLIFLEPSRKMPPDPNLIAMLTRRTDGVRWPTRSLRCIRALRVEHIYQILELSPDDFLSVPNFGQRSLDELNEFLRTMGLTPHSKLDEVVRRVIDEVIAEVGRDASDFSIQTAVRRRYGAYRPTIE